MIKIFLFHRVSSERDVLWDPMSVSHFDKCLKYISKKYKVLLFEELYSNDFFINSNEKYATIMFDDGYKDNIENALPILQKYNVKASFYVVTDCIEKNIPTWTYILDYSFQYTNENIISLNFPFLKEELRRGEFSNENDRIQFASKLKPVLKKVTHKDREVVLTQIRDTFFDVKIPEMMMNWNDLRKLKKLGHYIGSHSVTHAMLGTMNDEDVILKELLNSKKVIERELGHSPITISYPIGSFNEMTKRLSKKVGYKIGLAVKQRFFDPRKDDIFEVPRAELYNESWWKTKLRIYNIIPKIKLILNK